MDPAQRWKRPVPVFMVVVPSADFVAANSFYPEYSNRFLTMGEYQHVLDAAHVPGELSVSDCVCVCVCVSSVCLVF